MTIDIDALREYLKDEFLAAAFGVSPIAFMDVDSVERATPEELIEIALRQKVDLSKFEIKNGRGY